MVYRSRIREYQGRILASSAGASGRNEAPKYGIHTSGAKESELTHEVPDGMYKECGVNNQSIPSITAAVGAVDCETIYAVAFHIVAGLAEVNTSFGRLLRNIFADLQIVAISFLAANGLPATLMALMKIDADTERG